MSQSGTLIEPTLLPAIELIQGNIGLPIGPDAAFTVNILGGNNITTTGLLNTLTIDLTGTTDHAVQIGNATGSLTSLAVGTNGQVLLGSTGADPVFASLTSAGGTIIFTPGAGSLNLEAVAGGVLTINGDTGSATGAIITFDANTNCGSSVLFSASISTVNLIVEDASHNIIIGATSGNATLTGADNTFIGRHVGHDLTSGNFNTASGSLALQNLTTGSSNTAIGKSALTNLVTGSSNTAIGSFAGTNYMGAESSNVLIKNDGTLGESNTIRIGTQGGGGGQQNKCYIAGINGVTTASPISVTVDTVTGQMGTLNTGTLNQQQIFYVGKHGNDANNGLSIGNAKLTFGAALTAAGLLIPSAVNRFSIVCLDDGIYTENITCAQYVDIYAPNASLTGTIIAADDCRVKFSRQNVATATTGVGKFGGAGTFYVEIDEISCAGTADWLVSTSGIVQAQWKKLTVVNGSGIGDLTSAIGHIHVKGGDLYINGTGNGIARANAGSTVGHIDHIIDIGGGNGVGLAINSGSFDLNIQSLQNLSNGIFVSGGTANLSIQSINCTAAYGITGAGSTLNLICSEMIGTTSSALGAVDNIVVTSDGSNNLSIKNGGTTDIDSAGILSINSSAGVINLGNDNVNQNINIGILGTRTISVGNGAGASSVLVYSGTGAASFGANATDHTTTIGSTTGVSASTLQAGTGALTVNGGGVVTVDSVGVLELNSSGGVIGIGNDAVAQNINLGTGAAQRVITIGNITNATAVNINTGTAGTTHTTTNGTYALNTGTGAINIGTDAAAKTLTLGNGTGATSVVVDCGTGALNLGTNAIARTTTLGNTTGASVLALKYGTGDFSLASATGNVIVAQDTGEVTKPLQPAFSAYLSSTQSNVIGQTGTIYTIVFDTEIFDQNSDYNNGTGTFTAPVTGKYQFNINVFAADVSSAMTNIIVTLVTSNRSYKFAFDNIYACRNLVDNGKEYSLSYLADMDAADTATVTVEIQGGAGNTADVLGSANLITAFSGYLAC